MHIADYVWIPRHSWNLKGLISKFVAAGPIFKPAQPVRSQSNVALGASGSDALCATVLSDKEDAASAEAPRKNWGDHDLLIDVTRARFEEPENRPGKFSMWL